MPRGDIPRERMPEIMAGGKRLSRAGGWDTERTHRGLANESEAFKRTAFHVLFDHTHLPAEEVEQMRRITGIEDAQQAREHLANVLSVPQNREWLQGVLTHERALAGTDLAAKRFLWKNRAYVFVKGLKGRVGFFERLRGLFRGHPGTARHDIASGILSAIEARGGLPAGARPPAEGGPRGREEREEGEPTVNEEAFNRVLGRYFTPRKINLVSHVKEGMRLQYSHLPEKDRRQFVGSPEMYDYHATQLVHRAQPFIGELHALGFSNADVDGFVTHALNSANFEEFRKRMAVSLKEGSRKIESAEEGAPKMLSKFFLSRAALQLYDADGNQISEDNVSAHNVNELHRKLSSGDLVPLSPEQKSAYSFYVLAKLAREGNPEEAKTHLKRLVRNVRDEVAGHVAAIAGMTRERRFNEKRAGQFMLDLVMHGGLSMEQARERANRVLEEYRRSHREGG